MIHPVSLGKTRALSFPNSFRIGFEPLSKQYGQLRQAMFFSFLAFCLSLVGLIHAPQLGLTLSPMTLGYLLLTGLFGLFQLAHLKQVESS